MRELKQETAQWLVEQWIGRLTDVLESMTGSRPQVAWEPSDEREEPVVPGDALILQQTFRGRPEPLSWVSMPEPVWRELGSRMLQAAGINTADDADARNTCLELLSQVASGFSQALSRRSHREFPLEASAELAALPAQQYHASVTIHFPDLRLPAMRLLFSPSWSEILNLTPGPVPVPAEEMTPEGPAMLAETAPNSLGRSRTFDLLLDVALPVSVSFGRTELPIKDVLKLTTGSIVELNRAVSDPVDVIVNQCVIARGEVVVVDGNYGVRIQQIVSRQERLRTGSGQAVTVRSSRPNGAGVIAPAGHKV